MKKLIGAWAYWLGVISAVIALIMRTFNSFGVWLPGNVVQGITIWYMSFYKAALLFLLINIATALDGWAHVFFGQSRTPQPKDDDFASDHAEARFRTARAGT